MRSIRFFSAIFALLGIAAASLGVYLALTHIYSAPELLEEPATARQQVQTMFDALCEGDYDTVSACLYGQPRFGMDREAADPVGRLFWNAVTESFSWESRGDFHATDSGVSLAVAVCAVDIDSLTRNLRDRAQTLLEERVQAAENTGEIYDENNEYRTEFVMAVLHDAAADALEEDAEMIRWELTLNLIYENGQWWIMPEPELLEALSGGILG